MKYQFIVDWIKNYATENNIESLVVGVSGGIDSAVTSTLCAYTGIKTFCVAMPIQQDSNQENRADAHISNLKSRFTNVTGIKFDLTETYQTFRNTVNPYLNDLSLANSKARLRMTTLYNLSTMYNGIVVGTGNKVEDFGVGFYTKYGDGGVDISPIADLMKSEVYDAGKELEIIDSIMQAAPTDGLWGDNRTDEDQIGATYEELEWAMNFSGNLSDLSEKELSIMSTFLNFNKRNSHKMIPIPICKNVLKR